jgi:hypothetical protein
LKTIGGAKITLVATFPHFSHFCFAGASNPSRVSYWWPALQRYS